MVHRLQQRTGQRRGRRLGTETVDRDGVEDTPGSFESVHLVCGQSRFRSHDDEQRVPGGGWTQRRGRG